MKPKLKRLSLATLAYLLIFVIVAVFISYLQEKAAYRELRNRFDIAAAQLDSTLNEIENQAIFIGELPAVSEAANQQAYRLKTYLSLGDELEALNNVSKFEEIRFIHWSSRKVYQAHYGIFDLSRLDLPDALRRAQSGGFYFEPGKVIYYLPLPTSGRPPTALLELDLAPQTFFAYFNDIPVEIKVGDAIYRSPQEAHALDRWVEMDPSRYLAVTWQEGQAELRLKIPGELLLRSILQGLGMTTLAASIILIAVQLRTRRAQILVETNRRDLKLLLSEGGEDFDERNFENLREYLRESYLGLIRKNEEQQALIETLRAERSELRQLALQDNSDAAHASLTGLWLTTTPDHKDALKLRIEDVIHPDATEIKELGDAFYLLFYPLKGETSGDKRAYGLYYALEDDDFPLKALLISPEYLTMPRARFVQRVQEILDNEATAQLTRFTDETWLEEVQHLADYERSLKTYIYVLSKGEETEQALRDLLDVKLSNIASARELSEAILTRLRLIDYSFGDRTYPEFITAVLIVDRQQMLAEIDSVDSLAKLRQIFQSWDERMRKVARRSEEKSDVEIHVEHALEMMHERYREPDLSISEIAEALALNPVYFGRIFKDITRQTPLEYLTGLRLEAAKKLLIEGQTSMVMIAEQAGFNDQRSFARFFKKEMGVPPSQWKPPGQ